MLKYSQFSKWNKVCNQEVFQKMGEYFQKFEDADKRKNRIYFDIKVDSSKVNIVMPYDLTYWLQMNNYRVTDYAKGLCKLANKSDAQETRIGKVLTDANQLEILKRYNMSKDNTLKNTDDLQVVISRHPYDLIGISTGRGWTSCLDLDDTYVYKGAHIETKFKSFLAAGGLVCYLIRKSDRNIEKPIARIKVYYYPARTRKLEVCYETIGVNIPEQRKFITDWVAQYNNDMALMVK